MSSIGSALLSGASRFSSHFFSQGGAYANIGYLSTGIAQAVHQFKDGRPVAAGFTIAASAVDGLNGFHQLFTSIPHKDGKDSWWTKTKETANKWYPNWARGTTRMLAATSGGPVSLGLLNGAKDS